MERLNLNIPVDARARLRRIARAAARTEAEVARDLLLSAIDRSERDDFFRRVGEGMTKKQRERQIRLLESFEALE
jgi:hypothetical protein